ncbi:MAG: AsmA family protein [Stappiaceae bacterium]
MKRLLTGLSALIIVIVAIGFIVPFFLPKEDLKNQVVNRFKAETGWHLRIDGPIDLGILPFFYMNARDVGLSGEAGADGIEFVSVAEMGIELSWLALFTGNIEIAGVTLVEPKFFLEVDANGRTSWEPRRTLHNGTLKPAGSAEPASEQKDESQAAAPSAETDSADSTVAMLERIKLSAVSIINGLVVYGDKRQGTNYYLNDVNLILSSSSLSENIELDGDLVWQGQTFDITSNLDTPLSAFAGKKSPFSLQLSAFNTDFAAEGHIAANPVDVDINFTAKGDSLAAFVGEFNGPVDAVKAAGAYELAAFVEANEAEVIANNIKGKFAGAAFTGAFTAALDGPKPVLKGNLDVDAINLADLRADANSESVDAPTSETPTKSQSAVSTKSDDVSGSPAQSDLAILEQFDANFALSVGALSAGDAQIEQLKLNTDIRDGILTMKVAEAKALGGTVLANLVANTAGETAEVNADVTLNGLSASQIVALAGRSEKIAGLVSSNFTLKGRGKSFEEIGLDLKPSGTLKLTDGSVKGLDLASVFNGDTSADEITDLSVDVQMAGLEEPIRVGGGLNWRKEPFNISGSINPRGLFAGEKTRASVRVSSARGSIGYRGSVALNGSATGDVSLETNSLRGLMAWVGNPLPPGRGLEQFEIAGRFDVNGSKVSFVETSVLVDSSFGKGQGVIDIGGPVPEIDAELALTRLVLDPYLSDVDGQGGGNQPQVSPAAAPSAAPVANGWSTEPIDFSGLNAFNAKLDITAREILWEKLTLGDSRLKLSVVNGDLSADLQNIVLYEGTGFGSVELKGGRAPTVQAKLVIADVKARPLLSAAADFGWIEGRTNVEMDISASGKSEAGLIDTLAGTASFQFTDGAIRGVNIPRMVRSLSVQTLLGWNDNSRQKTDFSEFSASFAIERGLATNTDTKLVGPLVRMTGTGVTDFPAKVLDWRFDPKVVASLEGQSDTNEDLIGLGVPVLVKGPWDNPEIYPDIQGILENPDAAYKQLQSVSGDIGKLLGGDGALGDLPGEIAQKITKGSKDINVKDIVEGVSNDDQVLQTIEEGFGLPEGFLGSFGRKSK